MTTSRRVTFIVGLAVVVIAVVLAWGYVSPSRPHGKVVARLQKKDSGGYIHTVTVRQFAGRFNTELSEEGKPVRDLPVSSYEFFEGSDPITTATISWPELQRFTVSFDNGVTVDCSWERNQLCLDKTLITEPGDAPNPALASRFQGERQWRGVGDLRR